LRSIKDDKRNVVVRAKAEFPFDLWESTKFEAGDVGEYRGATDRDSIFDQKFSERAEEVIHLACRSEVERVGTEVTRQVGVEIGFELGLDMADAEVGVRQDGKAAASAGIVDMAACVLRQEGAGLWFHFGPQWGYTPVFL
jgi:hypothetical protein